MKKAPKKKTVKEGYSTVSSIIAEFNLLWGIAPPDSLKGKKGAEIKEWLKEKLTELLEHKAAQILAEKREYHNRQFHDNCYDCIDVTNHNAALDLAAQIIRRQGKE